MVVIAHRDGEEDPDAIALGSHSETLDEGIVRLSVWAHQELPLRAAPLIM